MKAICGADCNKCGFKENCAGCQETNGHPFGDSCMLAQCSTITIAVMKDVSRVPLPVN